MVYFFFTGFEFRAKPINFGAKFPIGTFQTIHIASERSKFMFISFVLF